MIEPTHGPAVPLGVVPGTVFGTSTIPLDRFHSAKSFGLPLLSTGLVPQGVLDGGLRHSLKRHDENKEGEGETDHARHLGGL